MTHALIMFDIDKTLARSKQPITPEMAEALAKLLSQRRVAVISGDPFRVIEHNVVAQLPARTNFSNFYLLPTSGGALYDWKDFTWHEVYSEEILDISLKHIIEIIRMACSETGLIDFSTPSFGERIEYRGAQVTLSALGQEAPIDKKEAWDPDGSKKKTLRDRIAKDLPEYDVKTGGSTSIDITNKGVNKAYGVKKLSEYLSIPIPEMIYVGDALYPFGNDEVVKETGITTHQVSGPDETLSLIVSLL